MEHLVKFLGQINVPQALVILLAAWFFYCRLEKKEKLDNKFNEIKKLGDKLSTQIEKVEDKVKKLDSKVKDIDRRLCRIEGSLATQGHCLYSQKNQPDKKAE